MCFCKVDKDPETLNGYLGSRGDTESTNYRTPQRWLPGTPAFLITHKCFSQMCQSWNKKLNNCSGEEKQSKHAKWVYCFLTVCVLLGEASTWCCYCWGISERHAQPEILIAKAEEK